MGSPISQPLAFWAHESMFHEIAQCADRRQLRLSVFVDDLTFSSETPVSKDCHREIQHILNAYGMTIHWDKIRYQPAGQPKLITGCSITHNGELAAPEVLTKKAELAVRRFRITPSLDAGMRALGLISSVRAIVPSKFEKERVGLRLELRRMRRERGRSEPGTLR